MLFGSYGQRSDLLQMKKWQVANGKRSISASGWTEGDLFRHQFPAIQ